MNPERKMYMNVAMAGSDHGLGYTTVPMGWNRTIWGDDSIVYVSPSGHLLHCAEDLQRYLLAEGTCKCGLECPLIIDRVFNFNPRVPARPKLPANVLAGSQLNMLCKHRCKLVAMAIGLQGNEETLANTGPPSGVPLFDRSKGSKRSRSRSKPERVVYSPQNRSTSQVLALQGGHKHQIPGFANFMPSLEPISFKHQLQQNSIESQQRQIQMHLLQMQHQELVQQHQQMQQHQLHHQHHQAPTWRRSQEVESLHSPVEQYSLEQRLGKRLHSSPPSSCPTRPPSNSGMAGSQSAPSSAGPYSTTPRCSKTPRLSSELESPSAKERQPLHGHSSLPFPFHGETHQLIVDGHTFGIHPDACAPSVIPLLSNMYHAQNRASLNAANVSNSQALLANNNDEFFFMQDGSRKGPSGTVDDSVDVPTCQPDESPVRTLEDNTPSPVVSKPITMYSTKPDKLTVGNMTLQQIFKQSLEGSAFPASSLLSAAARAQLAKQPQSPDSPSPHQAGDLMSGMGLFNKISTNLTSKDAKLDLAALPSNKHLQFSASRKLLAEATNMDAVFSTEMNVKGTSSAPQQTDESPIQCLENAVLNLKDHPSTSKPAVSALDVFSVEVTQDSFVGRKRPSTEDIKETLESSVKRQRLQSSDSVESQTKPSEAAMSTYQVPAINSGKLISMHPHDTTKVTGSYNVVCSTGKAASSSKPPTAENAELARWQQQQQEWYADMLRVKQHHEAGNMPVEHFPPGSQLRPHMRSRGLQELQYIAMGGNPSSRMPSMQQHLHMGPMHRFPNHFMNPQFNLHQANMMHHIQTMRMPCRMDHPVDPLDPNIPQNQSMCESSILQSMLQQQQQLQQFGMPPPGNYQHPMHYINPVHHLEPSQQTPQIDKPNLPQAYGQGQDTTKPGATSQHKKGAKPARGTSTTTSTTLACIVDTDDEEPKDAAYWVKAASKSGGVKKVKDILAMARSLKKHNSEAGQVEAIFQAVLDSASGGMKVIIKEGTRSQERVQSESADSNQSKGTDTPPKAANKSTDRSDSMCEASEQSPSPNTAQQNAVETDYEVPCESSDDLLKSDAIERQCGDSLNQTSSEPDMPTSSDDFRKAQIHSELSVTQMESKSDTAVLKTETFESVSLDGNEIQCPTQSEGNHMASPIHKETELVPEGSAKVPHQDNVQVITCHKIYTEGNNSGSNEISQWVSPPVKDTCKVSDQVQSMASTDQLIELPDSSQPVICQSTTVCGEQEVTSIDIKDSNDDDERQEDISLSFDSNEDEFKVQRDVKEGEDLQQDQLLDHAANVRTVSNKQGCSVHELEPNSNYSENATSDTVEEMDTEDVSDGSNDMAPLDAEYIDTPDKDQRETAVDQVKELQSTRGQSHTCELKDSVGTQPPLDTGKNKSSDISVDILKEEKVPHTTSSLPPLNPLVDTAGSSVKDQGVDDTAAKFSQENTPVQHSNDTSNDSTVLVSGDTVVGSATYTNEFLTHTSEVMESKELNSSPDTEVEVKPVTAEEPEQMDTVKCTPVLSEIVQQENACDFQPIDSNTTKHHEVMDNQLLDSTVDSETIQNSPLGGNVLSEQEAIDDNQLVHQDFVLGCKLTTQKQVKSNRGNSDPAKQVDQHDPTTDSEAVTQGQVIGSKPMKQYPKEDDLPMKHDPTEEDIPITLDPTEDHLPTKQDPNEVDPSMKQASSEYDLLMNRNLNKDNQGSNEDNLPLKQDPNEDYRGNKQDPNKGCLPMKHDSNEDQPMQQVSSKDDPPMAQDRTEQEQPIKQNTNEDKSMKQIFTEVEDQPMKKDPIEDEQSMTKDSTQDGLPVTQDPTENLPIKQGTNEEGQLMKQGLGEDGWPIKQDSNDDQPMKHVHTVDQPIKIDPIEDGRSDDITMKQDKTIEEGQPMKPNRTDDDWPIKPKPNEENQSVHQDPTEHDQNLPEDQSTKRLSNEEDQPMREAPTEKDTPIKEDPTEYNQPVEHVPTKDQSTKQLSNEDQPMREALTSTKQLSHEDQPMREAPTEEDKPIEQDPTEYDQPMERFPTVVQPMIQVPPEDQSTKQLSNEDKPMREAPNDEDKSIKHDPTEYEQPMEQVPTKHSQPMEQVSTDNQPMKQHSNEDQPIREASTEEDKPIKRDPSEHSQPLEQAPTEDQPVEHHSKEKDRLLKEASSQEDKSIKRDPTKYDHPIQQVPTEDQSTKQLSNKQDQPMREVSSEEDKPINPTEHDQPMERVPTKDQPMKHICHKEDNDLVTSLDNEQPMDTEPVQQDLEKINQAMTQDPVVDNEQVQDSKVNQDEMNNKTVDLDSRPMDIQLVKQDQCLGNKTLEQDHPMADEEVEHDELVEQMHPVLDIDRVKQDHTVETEEGSSVKSEPVIQDWLNDLREEASTDDSVKQCHLNDSESLRLDRLENLEIEDKCSDSLSQEQFHVEDSKSVKQHEVDICGKGSSEISETLGVDHMTSSFIKQDHAVEHESDEQEKFTSVDHKATDEVTSSNEQFKQLDTDMLDNTENSEPRNKGCFEHIKLMGKDEQQTTGPEVQTLFGNAETPKQSEDLHILNQNQTVDCELMFGDQLSDCELLKRDQTESVLENNADKSLVCTRPDTSCGQRNTVSDYVGSEVDPSQVTEVTPCTNTSLSSEEDEEIPDRSSSIISLSKLENTLSDSNNPFDGLHTVEALSLEIQGTCLASERTSEQGHIPSGALLRIQSAPESECLMTLESDSLHTAADCEAKESTTPAAPSASPCPSEDLEHNPLACRSAQRLADKPTLIEANTSSKASLKNLSFSELQSESSPVTVNGPLHVHLVPPGEEPAPETTIQTEMTTASWQHSLCETPKNPLMPQGSTQHRESPTPNGVLGLEHLNDIPRDSGDSGLVENQPDALTYQGIAEGEKQSTSDDERENRENKPQTDEQPVHEICTAKRESNLKRGVSETQKTVLSAREAGIKKERLVQEAPTRVLRGNVRADSSTELTASVFPRHLEIGDLVWGPIRGYPSWPGKLVSEAEVRGRSRREEGKMWVRWFGDHSCSQVEPEKLKTLSEGLEAHHSARQSYRSRGRRMNSTLEAAIQEAMNELDKKMEQAKGTKSKSVPKSSRPKTRCKRLR